MESLGRFAAGAVLLLAGCRGSYHLIMPRDLAPIDRSHSELLEARKIQRLAVVERPNSRDAVAPGILPIFNQEFNLRGLSVYSSADQEGIDGVLEIHTFQWTKDDESRFFYLDPAANVFKETDQGAYFGMEGEKVAFPSPVLIFTGAFVEPKTGKVVATFDLECPANWSLEADYVATVKSIKNRPRAVSEPNFSYAGGGWQRRAKEASALKVIRRAVARICGSATEAPAAR
jgi:hypothetical protein